MLPDTLLVGTGLRRTPRWGAELTCRGSQAPEGQLGLESRPRVGGMTSNGAADPVGGEGGLCARPPGPSWAHSPGCPPVLGIVWPWQGGRGGGQPSQGCVPESQALLASWELGIGWRAEVAAFCDILKNAYFY